MPTCVLIIIKKSYMWNELELKLSHLMYAFVDNACMTGGYIQNLQCRGSSIER